MKKFYILTLIVLMGGACSNEENLVYDNFLETNEDVTLTLSLQKATIDGAENSIFNEGLNGRFIGVTLQGMDGNDYDGKYYNNIPFKNDEGEWISTGTEMVISNSEGRLFAYYPYDETSNDIKQIPISIDGIQTDYMYAAPIIVNSVNSRVSMSFHHALALLEINIIRNANVADSVLKSISISGTGIATEGVLDATTGKITPSNNDQEVVIIYNSDDYVPTVEEVEADNSRELKKYILLFPNQYEDESPTGLNAGNISIKVKINDTTYNLDTKSPVTFKQNALFKCKVIGITPDTFISETENLTFVNDEGKQEYNVKNITGIMITDNEYLPGNHKMIVRTTFNTNPVQWRVSDDPFMNIPFYPTADGSNSAVEIFDGNSSGFSHITDGIWLNTEGALNDFDGKSNTEAIILANGGYEGNEYPIIQANAEALKNGWYIPSLGQLAVIYKYRNQINAELQRIKRGGGNANDILLEGYAVNWSSTTTGAGSAWTIYFDCGGCTPRAQSASDWTRNPNLVRDVE